MWMDIEIIRFLNEYAGEYSKFDKLVTFVCHNHLLKGGILMIAVYSLWFFRSEKQREIREHTVMMLIASVIALFVARVLALFLPFRTRPMYDPDVEFVLPDGARQVLETWSAFPSDHAVLFLAIATGLWMIFRRMNLAIIGVLVYLYVIVVILLPRVYLGLHYPSDLVFGGVIGAIIAAVCGTEKLRSIAGHYIVDYEGRFPGIFYAAFFFITFQIAVMFDPVREVARFVFRSLRAVLGA